MTKKITTFVYDDFGFLDVVGPIDVFTIANQRAGKTLYSFQTVSMEGRKNIRAESGMRLCIDADISQIESTHTFLIPGGDGFRQVTSNEKTMQHIRRLALKASRVVSVCTGAFILAKANVLNNRRATTHWALAEELAHSYPKIDVVADELFVSEGKYTTAAGIASGIDMALALVAKDHGNALAIATSQRMVLYLNRAGGQSQFSERFMPIESSEDGFDLLLASIAENPIGNLSNAALAEKLNISERHIARIFKERIKTSPARWVERVRVDHACRQLENGRITMEQVSTHSGFASVETMRQAFKRVMGVSPSQYRLHHGEVLL